MTNMDKIQFFEGSDIALLQENINNWLSLNKNINITGTNLNSIVKPDLLGNMQSIEKHVFYILYNTGRQRRKKELTEMEEPIPAVKTEINL